MHDHTIDRFVTFAEREITKLKDSLRLTQENRPQHSPGPVYDITGNVTESISCLDLKSNESSEECLGTISERTEEVDAHSEPVVFNVNVVNRKHRAIDAVNRSRNDKSPCKGEKTSKSHAKDTKRDTSKGSAKDTTKEMSKNHSKVQRKSPRFSKGKSGCIPFCYPSKETSKHPSAETKVKDRGKSTSFVNSKRSNSLKGSPQMSSTDSAKSLMKETPDCLGETLDPTSVTRDELGSIVGNLINELTVEVAKEVSSELSKKAFGSKIYKPVKYFPPRRGVIVNNANKYKSAKPTRKLSITNPEDASNTTLFDAVIASGIEGTAASNSTKSSMVRLKSNREKVGHTSRRPILNRSLYVPSKEQSCPRVGTSVTGKQPAPSVIQANQAKFSDGSKNWIPGSAFVRNFLEKNSRKLKSLPAEQDKSAVVEPEELSGPGPDINTPVPNGKMINLAKKAMANSGSLKISASCNHLQFKCIDEIEVYMAQNQNYKSSRTNSNSCCCTQGSTPAPAPASKAKAQKYSCKCEMKNPYNFCRPIERPIPHQQVSPGVCCKYCHQQPKVATTCIQADLVDRREEVWKRCATQTLPGISIESTCSCCEEDTVNIDSNDCCCTIGRNLKEPMYAENGNQTSPVCNSILGAYDLDSGRQLCDRLTKISFQEEKEEHIFDRLFDSNEDFRVSDVTNKRGDHQIMTVTRAISPIIFMCQDACIQNKPSQQDHSIATVLVADIPSTRPPEVICSTPNDDTIYTILCQRRLDSNSESCADNQICNCQMKSSKSGSPKNAITACASKNKSCACTNESDRKVAGSSSQRGKRVSISDTVEKKECQPSITCDSCQRLDNTTENAGCCGKNTSKSNSYDEEKKKKREREKSAQREQVKQVDRERKEVKASKNQNEKECAKSPNSTSSDNKCECLITCDPSARSPCKADCRFNKGTMCVKEKRQTETPVKSGCCQCCKKKKKKYCTSETCTSDICGISEVPEKSSGTSSQCTNDNCSAKCEGVNSRTSRKPLYKPRAAKSEDMSKSYRVAHCLHDNKHLLEQDALDAGKKLSASTSENYITVHDVSAQAEAVDLDKFNLSFTSIMGLGSPKRTASLDDFLNMLDCPSPRTPKRISVDPFPGELLANNKQSGRQPTIMNTCTSTIKFPDETRVNSMSKSNCNKIQSFLKSRNEVLSKSKYFDWKLMRRKKEKPTRDSRPGHDFLKSFRHPFDSQTSSEGEIDCQCSVSIGEIHQCEKKK